MKTLKTDNLLARFRPRLPATALLATTADRDRPKPRGGMPTGLSRAEVRQIVIEMIG